MIAKRGRPIFACLSVLLLASLTANYFLAQTARSYYLQLNATRLDPLGFKHFANPVTPAAAATPHVVFYGDSRAAEWPAPAVPGVQFDNRGISAQTSAQVWSRYGAHITPLAPDVLIVQVCINDLKMIPLFREARDDIVSTCQANLRAIIAQARQEGAVVILTTVFPEGAASLLRRFFWSAEVGQGIRDVNDFIAGQAADDVIIFDTNPILAGADGRVQPAYQRDLLHLNAAGYAALNEALADLLLDLVGEGRD